MSISSKAVGSPKEEAEREAAAEAARILRIKQQEAHAAYRRCDNLPYQPGINQVYKQCLADADEYARSLACRLVGKSD